jgi:hypothetical protein
MSNLPAQRSTGLFAALRGDGPAKEVARVQEAAFIERAHDAARRDLAQLRMADTAMLTHVGIDHAADITDHMVAKIARNSHAARAVSQLAEVGVFGLGRELRHYIEGSRG